MRRIRHDIGVLVQLMRDAMTQYFGIDWGGDDAEQATTD